jgi:ATP-dependent Clp protease protease subunit
MAGTKVLMAPTALMFIHNPLTIASGNSEDMQKAIEMLDEFKESIINAYELRTGLSRAKISHLMDSETWLNANKAIELGFADGILEEEKRKDTFESVAFAFSRRAVTNTLLNKLMSKAPPKEDNIQSAKAATVIPAELLYKRLNLIK